jgi:hypothetical protein
MTNGDRGDRLADEILFSIAATYGWTDYAPKMKVRVPVDTAELSRVTGTYVLDSQSSQRRACRTGGSHQS